MKTSSRQNEKNTGDIKAKRTWWRKGLRIFFWVIFVIFILVFLLLLFIRSPWGQDIIVGKATKYVSQKTETEVSIDKFFITFSGKLDVQGLYLEDKKGDTLLYSKELNAAIPIWPIIKGEPISINRVNWSGLRANVYRKDSIHGFNYQFLIDAFASDSTQTNPDTATNTTDDQPPKINVGSIDFSDFKINYNDAVAGMVAKLRLGKFHFQGKDFDLDKMRFAISAIGLENTTISYEQTKPLPPSEEDTAQTSMPFLSLDKFELKNVNLHYRSVPDSLEADADLAHFLLKLPKADLAGQVIDVDQLALDKSTISYISKAGEQTETPSTKTTVETGNHENEGFSWPDWKVKVRSIAFQDNDLHYQNGEKPVKHDHFNPDYIDLKDLVLNLQGLELSDKESFKANLKDFSFRETSGFNLKNLVFALDLDSTQVGLDGLKLQTGNSSLSADLNARYPSIQDFIDQPKNAEVHLDLNDFSLDLADALAVQPDLRSNPYFRALARKKITGRIKADGKLADMKLGKFLVKWGNLTSVRARGSFKNLTDPNNLYFAINNFDLQTRRTDVAAFISEDELGISIPDTIHLQSQLYGRLDDLRTKSTLDIPEGQIALNGHYANKNKIAFDLDLNVNALELGKILQNPDIGRVDFETVASGQGDSPENLTADFKTEFAQLEYHDYDYSALNMEGHLKKGKGNAGISYKDQNLILAIDSKIELDSLKQKVATDIDLEGIDLYQLNLMSEKIRGRGSMAINVENSDDKLTIDSHISKGEASYNDKIHHLGKLDLSALIKKDSTSLDIDSNFLNGKLRSNANPDAISRTLSRQLGRYFTDSTDFAVGDTIKNPVRLKMKMELTQNDLINNIFLPSLQKMDTLSLTTDFNQRDHLLLVDMDLPYLDYAGNIIDDLYFHLNSTVENGQFIFGFENLDAGVFGMNRTFFNGDLADRKLFLNFYAFNQDEEKFFSMHSEITGDNKNLKIHLLPYDLIADNQAWEIPENNQLVIHKDSITARDFVLRHEEQSVKIASNLFPVKRDNIGIDFKNFKLESILALFNPKDNLATGDLQGKIVAVNPFGTLGFLADFGIDDLRVLKAPLGDLGLKALSKELDKYRFKMGLKGEDIDLDLKGTYMATAEEEAENPSLDLQLVLNKFGLKTISTLSNGQLKDGTGYLSGDFSVKGELPSPEYNGSLKFNDAGVNIAQLNSEFHFNDDKIDLNDKGLYFNNFSINDANQNKFYIDGSILTKNLLNPEFNLSLDAKNFQLMNSTAEDNDLYYGEINLDINGTIQGKMSFPKIDLDMGINKSTDFTYVYSKSQASLEKQKGIVEFINEEQPDDFLTRKTDSTKNKAQLTGINLHSTIDIDKEAALSVIIDPQTGDKLEVSGQGNLDFNIAENGAMALTGSYIINDGYYKMSLYNLVKRKFDFKSGSTISWNGQPTDANLDITAIYSVEASVSDLMASQISGASDEEKNQYKQKLPFLVSLNVDGTIDRPELSFGLDMPEDARGALGGAVYSRVNQLNQDQGDLNKQVFSLLVMNRFFPDGGSDGSSGGFSSIARDNLNQALSDQLNHFSDQLMGNTGIKLNFGLDSYTDYQGKSSQQRTDLDITAEKSLFNDRLVVKAGTDVNVQGDARPGEENPLLGNVSVEYLLTKDGRWRIRGFRKNEYENVIDGQVYVNGIGLMFQRQFNKFNELWHSLFGGLKEEKEEERKKQRNPLNKDVKTNDNQYDNPKKEKD